MENIIFIITLIAFYLSYFLYTRYNLHMFQLNYYKNKEHMNWIKKNIIKLVLKSIVVVPVLFLATQNIVCQIIVIGLFLLMALINKPGKAKKPFVYTNRMKRLLLTINLIALVLVIATKIAFGYKYIITMAVLNILLPIGILIANYINMPINNLITKSYINDAKKKLESMPNLIVIGVTGSYGKTTMKTFLGKVLSSKYNVLVTPKNYNTTLGVVRTIRENLKATHEVFVCEMGATKNGDIKEICDLVKPKYGVITSIGEQHLESFKTVENIINTKFELADSIPEDGIVFLNADNELIKNKEKKNKYIYYGTNNQENKYNAKNIENSAKGLSFNMEIKGEEKIFSSKLLGEHNVINIAGAIAVAEELGIETEKTISKVRLLETAEHRLQVIKGNNSIIIDDAYNSNPAGARAALNVLNSFNGTRILITPGMIELGEKQYQCNFEFGEYAALKSDYIILVGKEQTKPIQDGIEKTGFSKEKLHIVNSLNEGLAKANELGEFGKEKIILLENDLPDNY